MNADQTRKTTPQPLLAEETKPEAAVISPLLARLIEEVRVDKISGPHAYNRQHNRHNR
jgi:hypothetical protein